MVILRKLSQDHSDALLVMKLYLKTFPSRERIDLSVLFERMPATLLGIYTDKNALCFAGFFIVIEEESIVHLQYFAICPEMRSTDIDSQALQALMQMYGGRPLMVTYENICHPDDHPDRRDYRRTFYLKNGFHECPWYALYGDTQYGLASSAEKVNDVVIGHLLHLYQSFNTNFYTHTR